MFFKQISDLKNARILICNDDGIDAEGIKILEEETSKICGDVWVAAPDRQKSSSGHAHVSSMLLPRNCTSAEEVGQIKKLTTGILPSTARRATASIWLCVFFFATNIPICCCPASISGATLPKTLPTRAQSAQPWKASSAAYRPLPFHSIWGKTPVKTGTHPVILSGRCLND